MLLKLDFYKSQANILDLFTAKNFCIIIILFFLLFHFILNECDRDTPIKLPDGSCVMKYCTKEEYESEKCILDNPIIKTQYLNNIIKIGEPKFRYLNFIQFSNGDMIFGASSYPANNTRFFYGLKSNGRYYFKKNNNSEETPFKCLISDNEDGKKYESANSILISDGKEYLISIGRVGTYTELFDFENSKIISRKTEDLIGYNNKNMRSNLLNIDKETNTYILNCISEIDNNKLNGNILHFNLELQATGLSFSNNITYKIENTFGEISSCFITEKHKTVICFYIYQNETLTSYLLIAYNSQLEELKKEFFKPSGFSIFTFFYSIFFRENAGAFIYYKNEMNDFLPIIFFKEYNVEDESFKYYFSNNDLIILDKFIFRTEYLINDLIKISDNKLGFFTSSQNLETLFITLINIFNNNDVSNIKIRYYSIENYQLLNFKLNQDIKGFIFNDFIILATSYCLVVNCTGDDKNNYSSQIMIIGYPNKDDEQFDIIDYLLLNNDNSIENITLDLSKNITIDNNVFGYIYNGIKIQSIKSRGNIYLVSSTSNNIINNLTDNELDENEKITIKFDNNIYNKSECILEYSIIVTEPKFEEYEKYPINVSTTYGDDNEELFNAQKKRYIGRSIYYNIILSEDLTNNCKNKSCALCFEKNISCITYRPYIEIITESIETEKNTYYQTEMITNKIEKPTELMETDINTNYQTELIIIKNGSMACTNKEIFENKCQNIEINGKQIEDLYNKLKETINKENRNNNKITIKTKNAIFQLISLENIINENEEDKDISTIDLGKCLEILKESTNHPLKIIKIDIKSEDLTSTYVQYEIYDSITGEKIELNICHGLTITINVPKKLDDETLYNIVHLKDSGYNFLDKNDSFYNDICTTYTSIGGKDVLLYDRYNDIYAHINKMYICQTDCELISYNTLTEKAECNCKVQQEEMSLENIKFIRKEILQAFLGVLQNSNSLVLKCYNLLLDFSKLLSNYGFIIMSIILLLDFILILIYIIMKRNKIIEIIKYFIKIKFEAYGSNKDKNSKKNKIGRFKEIIHISKNKEKVTNNKNKNGEIKTKKPIISKKTSINKKEAKKNINKIKSPKKSKILNNKTFNNENLDKKNKKINLKEDKKKHNFPPKRILNNIKNISINNNIYNINLKDCKTSSLGTNNFTKKYLLNKKNKIVVNNRKNFSSHDSLNRLKSYKRGYKDHIKKNEQKISNNKFVPKLNDQEINCLEYKQAVNIDKRTYFQFYLALLKRKQLLLFAFYPNNDYNINELKISLLLLSFSLYFTINGFFFSDKTMHKIYKDKSSYNIIYQIPIMIYSTLISSFLNIILRQLSLSENNILSIAQAKNYKNAVKQSKITLKCLRIKFSLFFILRIIILLFCWYYICCFCAVYINTQIALVSDTFISYGLSMIYPFGLNLLPGVFRIPALRAKNKDKLCLYKFSNIISLI